MLTVEIDREDDGRYLAEVLELPGVMAYGATPELAEANALELALAVLVEHMRHWTLPEQSRLMH